LQTRHRDLCREAKIPIVGVVEQFFTDARETKIIPLDRLPSIQEDIPTGQQAQTITKPSTRPRPRQRQKRVASSSEDIVMDDLNPRDSEEDVPAPKGKGKQKAKGKVRIADPTGTSKRQLQESPSRQEPESKRSKTGTISSLERPDFSQKSFLEDSVIDTRDWPEMVGQVRDNFSTLFIFSPTTH
jgi:hypothetical protein